MIYLKILWYQSNVSHFHVSYPMEFTWNPSYVQLPNFISHFWSSKGNHVMSILHVLLNIPGGMNTQLPLLLTTTLVAYVLSKPSSALNTHNSRTVYTVIDLSTIIYGFKFYGKMCICLLGGNNWLINNNCYVFI